PFRRRATGSLSFKWLRCLLQRLQVSNDRLGVGAIHVVLRHGWTRGLAVRREAGHEELDGFLVVPALEAGNVRRGVRPDWHGDRWRKRKLRALQPFPLDELALLVHGSMAVGTAGNSSYEVLAMSNLLLFGCAVTWCCRAAVSGCHAQQRRQYGRKCHFSHLFIHLQ